MKLRLKINGFLIVLALILVTLFPAIFFRQAKQGVFDELIEITGFVLILLGQLFRISARGYKSENSSQSLTLVQGGPYSLVRNPMYLGIFLIGLGIVLILFEWWVMLAFLVIFINRYITLIFKEENKLLKTFSGEYQNYMQHVPRLMPSLKELFYRDISEYLPLKFAWVRRELGSVFALLLVVLSVESWKDIYKEGWVFYGKELIIIIIIILLLTGISLYLERRTTFAKKNGTAKS